MFISILATISIQLISAAGSSKSQALLLFADNENYCTNLQQQHQQQYDCPAASDNIDTKNIFDKNHQLDAKKKKNK